MKVLLLIVLLLASSPLRAATPVLPLALPAAREIEPPVVDIKQKPHRHSYSLYTSVWNSEAKLCAHGSSADADLPWREVGWTNPGPGTVYIRGFSVFIGTDYGKVVDLGSHFGSLKTWNLFGDVAFERYSNPSTANTITRMFSPDYIEIPPEHDITLKWYCANWLWETQGEVSAQYIYWVYWTDERPE